MSGRTKEFFAYVVPSVLAFALSGVYTIVDGFFVGQSLGDIGLAAITLGYPVTALVVAVGTGLGLAAAIRYTILNAQTQTQKAQECFSAASLLMLLMSAVLTALLFFFAEPILRFLVGLVESSAAKLFQRVKKVCKTFLHASKHATFFMKLCFTKNLAMLVKKPDNSGVFDGYLSNLRRDLVPLTLPLLRIGLLLVASAFTQFFDK